MWTLKNLLLFLSCVFLLFLGVPIRIKPQEEVEFENFLQMYNKSYPDEIVYKMRLQAFKDSLETINRLNSLRTSESSALYGITEFSDLPQEEFVAKHLQKNYIKRRKSSKSVRAKRNSKINNKKEVNAELRILKDSKFGFKLKHDFKAEDADGFIKSDDHKSKEVDTLKVDQNRDTAEGEKNQEFLVYRKGKKVENDRKRRELFDVDDQRKSISFEDQKTGKYRSFRKPVDAEYKNAGMGKLTHFENPNTMEIEVEFKDNKIGTNQYVAEKGIAKQTLSDKERNTETEKISRHLEVPAEYGDVNGQGSIDAFKGMRRKLVDLNERKIENKIHSNSYDGNHIQENNINLVKQDQQRNLTESYTPLAQKYLNIPSQEKGKLIDAYDENPAGDPHSDVVKNENFDDLFELDELFDILKSNKIRKPLTLQKLPTKIDWRKKGVVTEVNNQHSCGACWAFSVVEMIESVNAINGKALEKLSTQQLIDCAGNDNEGCGGGYVCPTLEWMMDDDVQLVSENRYPLHLKTEKCDLNKTEGGVRIKSYSCDSYVNNEEYLLFALAYRGPVAVVINAMLWQYYLEGVIHYHCSSELQHLNHAAQIVGYNLEAEIPHYIVRNSWGTGFGDHGYLYIAIGKNMCGLANEVAIVQL